MKKLILTIFIVVLFTSQGFSATYFIDYGAANNDANGTTSSTPWKHCPGDPRADSNADITLSAADVVVFKGGITYEFADGDADSHIPVNASGSEGNIIYLRSGHLHAPVYGSGRAIIDGTNANLNYASNRTGVIYMGTRSYVTIEGLQIQHAPWVAYTGLIGWFGSSGSNIVIDDVVLLSDISPPNDLTSAWAGIVIQGEWTGVTPATFTISDSEIYDIGGHGIFLRAGMTGVTISNNVIHDCGPNPSPYQGDGFFTENGGAGGDPTNITITGNDFYDFAEKGCGLVGGGTTILIEKNYCYDDDGTNGFGFTIRNGDNITMRNNLIVFDNEGKWEGLFRIKLQNSFGTTTNVYYYNNTLIGLSADYGFYLTKGDSTLTNVYLSNNVHDFNSVGTPKDYILVDTISGTFESNYNIFYGGDALPYSHNGTSKNLADWRTAISDEANSSEEDPGLDGSYKPDNISDAVVGAGENNGVVDDKDGNSRPQGIGFDVGAYEFLITESIAITGTMVDGGVDEGDLTGEKFVLTASGDEFVETLCDDNQITTDFLAGIDAEASWDFNEAAGFVAEVTLVHGNCTRDSAAQVTVEIAAGVVNITQTQTGTWTVPASSMVSATQIVATPTIPISVVVADTTTGQVGTYSADGAVGTYSSDGHVGQ